MYIVKTSILTFEFWSLTLDIRHLKLTLTFDIWFLILNWLEKIPRVRTSGITDNFRLLVLILLLTINFWHWCDTLTLNLELLLMAFDTWHRLWRLSFDIWFLTFTFEFDLFGLGLLFFWLWLLNFWLMIFQLVALTQLVLPYFFQQSWKYYK